jgi:hypothetical protein
MASQDVQPDHQGSSFEQVPEQVKLPRLFPIFLPSTVTMLLCSQNRAKGFPVSPSLWGDLALVVGEGVLHPPPWMSKCPEIPQAMALHSRCQPG